MQAEEASIHNNPNNICESILITIRIVRFGNRKNPKCNTDQLASFFLCLFVVYGVSVYGRWDR